MLSRVLNMTYYDFGETMYGVYISDEWALRSKRYLATTSDSTSVA
jgi:hypothetical protein